MNMLVDPKKLAMHELLHLNVALTYANHKPMTLTQLHEHAEKLSALIGSTDQVKSMGMEAGRLEIFLQKVDGTEFTYSVQSEPVACNPQAFALAPDYVTNSKL